MNLCSEVTNSREYKKKLRNTTNKMKKNNSFGERLTYIVIFFTAQLEHNNGYSVSIIQLKY